MGLLTGSTSPAGNGNEYYYREAEAAGDAAENIKEVHALVVYETKQDLKLAEQKHERDSLQKVYNALLAQTTTP